MEKKMNKFVSILKRDNESIKAERAERIGQSVKEAQIGLLLEMKSGLRVIEDKLSSMTDLSASNNAMDVNAIKDINSSGFVKEYQKLKEQLKVLEMKFDIAVTTAEELFGIDIDSLS